jgi:hypothetical protein
MHFLFEIIYALIEGIVSDVLAYLPKKIYRGLMTLLYGPLFVLEPKRIQWLPRYTLGISSVLLTIGIIGACVLLAYKAILAIQS